MNYLVTGCAGFIGSSVCKALLIRGDRVIGVDNMNDYYDPRLKEWRIKGLMGYDGFSFHQLDISDRDSIQALFADTQFDAVLNLAARAGVRASVESPYLYYQSNVIGTLNLLECCKTNKVRRFVLASTSSVYGLNKTPFREEDSTDRSLSPYAASKKAAEVLCYSYHYLYGIDVSIPRYFTVYGPSGRPDMSYFHFIRSIDQGKPVKIYGDGEQKRDFTFIDDIVEGTLRSLELSGFNILNLGNESPVKLIDFLSLIEAALGKKAKIVYLPRHSADVLTTWADTKTAKRLMGWSPQTALRDGLMITVKWFEENRALVNSLS